MHDETQKTNDQNRAPNTSTPSVTTAPQTNPAGGRLDDTDKPSDASKTQSTGSEKTGTRSDNDSNRPDRKPIDQHGKPSPLIQKTPQTEGQGRPDQTKNQPAKTQDDKPAGAANATPNAV